MTASASASRFRATLISMPWALFNRPSLQLAALKAYVEQEMGAEITTAHPFLHIAAAIGIDVYRRISETSWAGEALFAPLVFPGQRDKARRLFGKSLREGGAGGKSPDYDELVATIAAACRNWVAHQDFSSCRLLGFTVCFGQLLSSLHLARLIREQGCSAPVVLGGSSCSGTVGRALLAPLSPDRLHRRRRGRTAAPRSLRLSRRKHARTAQGHRRAHHRPRCPLSPTGKSRSFADTRFSSLLHRDQNGISRVPLHPGAVAGIFQGLLVEPLRLLQPQPSVAGVSP